MNVTYFLKIPANYLASSEQFKHLLKNDLSWLGFIKFILESFQLAQLGCHRIRLRA